MVSGYLYSSKLFLYLSGKIESVAQGIIFEVATTSQGMPELVSLLGTLVAEQPPVAHDKKLSMAAETSSFQGSKARTLNQGISGSYKTSSIRFYSPSALSTHGKGVSARRVNINVRQRSILSSIP
jgi:hypothetical protein